MLYAVSGEAESQTKVSDEIPCAFDGPHLPRWLSLMHLKGCRAHLCCAERGARLCSTGAEATPPALELPAEAAWSFSPGPSTKQNKPVVLSALQGTGDKPVGLS